MPRVHGFEYSIYNNTPSGIEMASLSDAIEYAGVKGYSVDVSGTLAVVMEDGSEGTIPVLTGVQYSGAVKTFKSTGSTGVTNVSIFY